MRGIATSFYESLSENIDFWVKTLYTEAMDTANDIWRNAKPHTQRFLDDVGLVCMVLFFSVLFIIYYSNKLLYATNLTMNCSTVQLIFNII